MGHFYGVTGRSESGNMSKWKAAKASLFLSLLFLVVYGATNWLTSLRSDVDTVAFAWERHIPFVPWMIIPYMSIDLFFIAAPFLCRSEEELRILARRITFGIVVAGACFLLFPFRFAFERPSTTGWLGAIFDQFRAMDQPYNLLPSLHITLRTILAAVYVKHARGFWRVLCHVWFSLIGFSTLFTYQHHLLDVLGGFVLAAYCFYVFSEQAHRLPVVPNRRIGAYYVVAAALFLVLGWMLRPPGMILLWFVAAMGIVASAYFGGGPGIFRKRGGRLPLSTRLALAPYLIGQWLSLLYYSRQCRPWDVVLPNVWIGRKLRHGEAVHAIERGVTAVVDLTADFDEAEPFLISEKQNRQDHRRGSAAVSYLNVPILDLTAPTQQQLHEIVRFIAENAAGGTVFVHCKIGYSRSAAVVGAYLLAIGRVQNADDAIGLLRRARPSIVVRPEVYEALIQFAEKGAIMAR
jgi:membrane-associated phospholipid phosphatase